MKQGPITQIIEKLLTKYVYWKTVYPEEQMRWYVTLALIAAAVTICIWADEKILP